MPRRRTLTRIWSVIPAQRRRRYGAYARWDRKGRWSPDELWRRLVVHLVEHWAPNGRLVLLLDDTDGMPSSKDGTQGNWQKRQPNCSDGT